MIRAMILAPLAYKYLSLFCLLLCLCFLLPVIWTGTHWMRLKAMSLLRLFMLCRFLLLLKVGKWYFIHCWFSVSYSLFCAIFQGNRFLSFWYHGCTSFHKLLSDFSNTCFSVFKFLNSRPYFTISPVYGLEKNTRPLNNISHFLLVVACSRYNFLYIMFCCCWLLFALFWYVHWTVVNRCLCVHVSLYIWHVPNQLDQSLDLYCAIPQLCSWRLM